jgi:multicomponent Na+:H+ antiporter subunit F
MITGDLAETMPVLAWSVSASFVLVMIAVVLAFFRLIQGPSLPDRVVALDLMTVLIVTFCGLYSLQSGSQAFLDVAVALALVGFLATVALARYVEREAKRGPERTHAAPIAPQTESSALGGGPTSTEVGDSRGT